MASRWCCNNAIAPPAAIEGFNAALRPYLYVHKGVTQGFLVLFPAWFNSRTRAGTHKGPAPTRV